MMFLRRMILPALLAVLLIGGLVSSATAEPKKSKHSSTHKSSHHVSKKYKKHRGQQAIDSGRAKQIQEALVREHYLNGEPSGTWDASTEQAMRRYQADQGWQTKTVPDSRALIRLGLGPNRDHLLNPESAMVTGTPILHPKTGASGAALSGSAPAATITPVSSGPTLSSSR